MGGIRLSLREKGVAIKIKHEVVIKTGQIKEGSNEKFLECD